MKKTIVYKPSTGEVISVLDEDSGRLGGLKEDTAVVVADIESDPKNISEVPPDQA